MEFPILPLNPNKIMNENCTCPNKYLLETGDICEVCLKIVGKIEIPEEIETFNPFTKKWVEDGKGSHHTDMDPLPKKDGI